MPCLSACSSRKSNMYLMARGRAEPRCAVLKMVSKRSSTNFCRVPCAWRGRGSDTALPRELWGWVVRSAQWTGWRGREDGVQPGPPGGKYGELVHYTPTGFLCL